METIQQQNPVSEQDNSREVLSKLYPNGVIPRMKFREAVSECISKYAVFKGRARRSEYWWFSLFYLLAIIVPMLPLLIIIGLDEASMIDMESGLSLTLAALSGVLFVIGLLACLVCLIPCFAVQVRRLHDIGRSGWWVVLSVVLAIVSVIISIVVFGSKWADVGEIEQFSLAFKVSMAAGLSMLLVNVLDWAIGIALFVFSLLDSHKGTNKYGASPKYL